MTKHTPQDLFNLLDQLDIKHSTIDHPPLFTVKDGLEWHNKIPGMHCKNLFMKDKKKKLWLIVMPGDKRAHISKLEREIGSARLSFGKPELLEEVLGITPGHVTPFALLNDISRQVTVVLDQDMMKAPMVNFHPLHNQASTTLKSEDLLRFIKHLSYNPYFVDCGQWTENETK